VTRIICGVDVASRSLAARVGPDGAEAEFANNREGIAALEAFCRTHQTELIAMEATGGYEQQAFLLLSAHGLPVAILNPRQVRRFAQSVGRDEKTDAIDAGLIAWYAQVRCCPSTAAPAPDQQHRRAERGKAESNGSARFWQVWESTPPNPHREAAGPANRFFPNRFFANRFFANRFFANRFFANRSRSPPSPRRPRLCPRWGIPVVTPTALLFQAWRGCPKPTRSTSGGVLLRV